MKRVSSKPSKGSGAHPALRRLGLAAEHFEALARQGFVAVENRGGPRKIHKLRFRFSGKQLVKYLGSDSCLIDSVRREVHDLQFEHAQRRELRRLTVEANELLRSTKQAMLPIIAAQGLRFHGYEIRRRSDRSANDSS